MTELILGGRCSGKTTALIKKSFETGAPILVTNRQRAEYVAKQALVMGYKIPTPITVEQCKNREGMANAEVYLNGVLIDEVTHIIGKLLPGISINSATWTKYDVTDLDNKKEEGKKENMISITKSEALVEMLRDFAVSHKIDCECSIDGNTVEYGFSGYGFVNKGRCNLNVFSNIFVAFDRITKRVTNQLIKRTYHTNYLGIDYRDTYDNYVATDLINRAEIKNAINEYSYLRAAKCKIPYIKKVYFNDPVTVVLWTDGTKTIVRSGKNDIYDPEKGLAMAISKKFLGSNSAKSNYYDEFKKWLPEEKEKEETPPPIGKVTSIKKTDDGVKVMADIAKDFSKALVSGFKAGLGVYNNARCDKCCYINRGFDEYPCTECYDNPSHPRFVEQG